MPRFEKIPNSQYVADGGDNVANVTLPLRATSGSAGYDFYLPMDVTIQPKQKLAVPTGVRISLPKDCFLAILPKSGLGTKYQLNLANTIGIIDSDYYNATNYGHILVCLVNNGKETITLPKGKAFVQGIIIPYRTTDDDNASGIRTGGYGSTDK